MLALLALCVLGSVSASSYAKAVLRPLSPSFSTPPTWNVSFNPQQFGQVDNVVLGDKTLFATLVSGVSLVGFNAETGAATWARQETANLFSTAASGGPYVVVIDTSPEQQLFVTCYLEASPTRKWQVQYANSSASSVAVSEDGATVAVGVNTMVDKLWSSQVLLLDGATGRLRKAYACSAQNTTMNVITGLLALDPTGTVVAYTCILVGTEGAAVVVRDATAANTTLPLLQTVSEAASGTGFALSRRGAFFAFGVSETHVFKRVGAVYQLLFTRSPVSPLDGRLLEAIAFDAKDAKPLLATAYFTVFDSVSQRSFMEVFDLANTAPQKPVWIYNFVNTTRQYQVKTLLQILFRFFWLTRCRTRWRAFKSAARAPAAWWRWRAGAWAPTRPAFSTRRQCTPLAQAAAKSYPTTPPAPCLASGAPYLREALSLSGSAESTSMPTLWAAAATSLDSWRNSKKNRVDSQQFPPP